MTSTPPVHTVLVVDDTPENIDVLTGILSPHFKVKAARNGARALRIAQNEKPPDIILLDIMMPEMDGFEVCRVLKSQGATRNVPIIFVTAKADIASETAGFELGAADYIQKPVSPPIVLARVKTQLALYDQNRVLEEKVRRRTQELHTTRLEIIHRLGRAAEYKDNETGLHVIRMSYFSQILGRAAGLSEADAELLLNAAPMHDIGKIGIPDRILLKPGKLDAEEWAVMRRHPEMGGGIIGEHGGSRLLNMAHEVAMTHHEKWNGQGYPKGLQGEEIPQFGRIVAVADVFDALASDRPYKKAWTLDRVVALLKEETGQHFDPELIPLFLDNLPAILEIKEKYREQA